MLFFSLMKVYKLMNVSLNSFFSLALSVQFFLKNTWLLSSSTHLLDVTLLSTLEAADSLDVHTSQIHTPVLLLLFELTKLLGCEVGGQ